MRILSGVNSVTTRPNGDAHQAGIKPRGIDPGPSHGQRRRQKLESSSLSFGKGYYGQLYSSGGSAEGFLTTSSCIEPRKEVLLYS